MLGSGVAPKARLVEQELAKLGSCLADGLGGGGISNLGVSEIIQKLRDQQECRVCMTRASHSHVAGDSRSAMLLSLVEQTSTQKSKVGNNLKGVLSATTAAEQIFALKKIGVETVSVPLACNYAGAHIPTRMVSARRCSKYTNVLVAFRSLPRLNICVV